MGKQKGKVEAAVGSVHQQQSEARSPPWKRGSRRQGSRNLWCSGGREVDQHIGVVVLTETIYIPVRWGKVAISHPSPQW